MKSPPDAPVPAPVPPGNVIHIRPSRAWWRLDWREFWEYRDLLMLLVRRDFVSKYKQTVLGPAWFVLQPLLLTLVFTVIFGNVAQIPTDGLPPLLFYLGGLLGWTYFANTLSATSDTFSTNSDLFGKVYFPRLVVPISLAISNSFAWLLQVVTFAAFWLYYRFCVVELPAAPWCWLLPLLLAQTAILALGVGLLISTATAKYKDLTHATSLIVQIWMYATPIIYPLSQVPEKWRWLVELNPMAFIVESYKYLLLGEGSVSLTGGLISVGMTLGLFLLGVLLFHRTERTFIDTV